MLEMERGEYELGSVRREIISIQRELSRNNVKQYGSISWKRCSLRGRILEYERNEDPAPLVYRLLL